MAQLRRVNSITRQSLQDALQTLDKSNVQVGWFASSKYNDKNQTPVAYVAAINELGPHARPFMRPTAENYDREWVDAMAALSKRITSGKMTVEQALDALGLKVAADISATIAQVFSPPLTPATIANRRRDPRSDGKPTTQSIKPLNDTGYMVATLTSVTEIKR